MNIYIYTYSIYNINIYGRAYARLENFTKKEKERKYNQISCLDVITSIKLRINSEVSPVALAHALLRINTRSLIFRKIRNKIFFT